MSVFLALGIMWVMKIAVLLHQTLIWTDGICIPGTQIMGIMNVAVLPYWTLNRTVGGCIPCTQNYVGNEDCCITTSDTESDWQQLYTYSELCD